MKKQIIITAIALSLVSGFIVLQSGAMNTVTAAHSPQISAPENVSFKNDIQPILERRCIKCHGGNFPSEGLNMETYDGLMQGSENGQVVLAGDSGDSLIIEMLQSGKMPKRGSQLTAEQIETIKQWINEGALNN